MHSITLHKTDGGWIGKITDPENKNVWTSSTLASAATAARATESRLLQILLDQTANPQLPLKK